MTLDPLWKFSEETDGSEEVDEIYLTVISVDIDVDSDNNNGTDLPDLSPEEDDIEKNNPGKVIPVNNDDDDSDGIPDYDDGYNLDALIVEDEENASEDDLYPVVVKLFGTDEQLNGAIVKLSYSCAAPNLTSQQYYSANGGLRLWMSNMSRSGDDLISGGDFVGPDWYFTSELDIDDGHVMLYMEGINSGQYTITAEVDLEPEWINGNLVFTDDYSDKVKVTVIKVDIAMDGNRDGNIDFDNLDDRQYLFWVNDDHDYKHHNEDMDQEDDKEGASDCSDNTIGFNEITTSGGCLRDLEDFTRLWVRVDENVLDLPNVECYLEFIGIKINVFEAVDSSLDYLTDKSIAESQIEKTKLDPAGSGRLDLDPAYLRGGNQYIVEGVEAGQGEVHLVVCSDGHTIADRSIDLELRPSLDFVDYPGGSYNDDFTESDDYLLFVHGYNVTESRAKQWTTTVFSAIRVRV